MKVISIKFTLVLLLLGSILNCEKNPTSIVITLPQKTAYIPRDDFQLYLVDANGKNLQRLTDFEIGTIRPPREYPTELAWSPNRNIIAYSTVYRRRTVLEYDSSLIYTVDNNKKISKIVKLKGLIVKDLSFSPDAQKLLYTVSSSSYVLDGARICIANIDGSNQSFITPMPSHPESFLNDPCWSPDGSQIAFISYEDSIYYVSIVSASGGMITHLSSNSGWLGNLGWSPDGKKLVFYRENLNAHGIYTINADGTDLTRLSDGRTPEWSPDGSKIVFCTPWSGAQVCTIKADGSDYRQLTLGDAYYWEPTWFPNGENIAYVKNSRKLDIYTINISSSNEIRVTDIPWAAGGFMDYKISPAPVWEQ